MAARSSGCSPPTPTGPATSCPGPGPGAVDIGRASGWAIAICWEIAFDDLVADSVDAGAQVLAVPSNNATFGLTEMTYQQLAMSRVRAVEHDRAVLVATTSGVSATIAPDGTVTASDRQFTPDVLVDRNAAEGHHYAGRSAAGGARVGAAWQPDWSGSRWPRRDVRARDPAARSDGARGGAGRRGRAWLSRRGRCWW